jgi:cyclase
MHGRRVVYARHTVGRWLGARSSIVWTLAAMFVWQFAFLAYAQNQKPARPLHIEKIRGDLYMISGDGGDVGVEVTNEGVILGDDMFDRNHDDLLAQVRTVSDKPIKYVFNTHYHDDHSGGDAKMLPFAEIIAHQNLRANLAAKKQPYYEDTPGTPIGLPQVTFTDEASVHLGGKEVRALYFGRGHTNGDAIIYYPDEKTIQTGDLFLARTGAAAQKLFIFVDYAHGGSLFEWTRTLDRALALDFDRVIPGHGPVSTREDLLKFRSDLEAMRTHIVGLIKQGKSKADIASTMESDYGWKSAGCPPTPPVPGCLSIQQLDSLIEELKQ